ncbi:putative proton-dependent oligopeptide transporter family, MFS transporter superfamily [Helianthus annuus]|nr:putative proton-dependent oligopeptide transporter family, MFS transporter superfamily [Helianthus annuus]
MDIEKGGNEGKTPEISTRHLDVNGKEKKRNSSYKQEDHKMILKSVLKMIPMCVVFSVLSLISATGSTFYLQQYNNLNTDSVIAIQFYSLVQDSSKFVIPFIYGCCLPKNEKVKIGVGIVCGVASCICAWQLEVYRLKEVSHLVDQGVDDAYTSISFLWLVPQFCLLGCMEGLIDEGLLKFYYSQTKQEQHLPYVKEYIALVMGIGKLLNIFLILVFKGWFQDTVNRSRLDKYYLVLVILSSANFITYCFIARLFYKVQELTNVDQDFKNDELPEENQLELDEADQEQGESVGNSPDLVKVVKFS